MSNFIITEVSRDTILKMVKHEQEIRYSKGIQEAYTQQYYASKDNPNYKPVNIEIEIQKFVLLYHEFNATEDDLHEYWKIPSTYWNDEEIKNSIFYMKLNIFQYPKVEVGDDLIDTNLIDYSTNKQVSLAKLHMNNRPLVLLAGSMT